MNHHNNIVIANLVFTILIFLMLAFLMISVVLAFKYTKDVTNRLEKIENK
jgi:hypothetical protein